MPRTRAGSRSSCARTLGRSAAATSAGSLRAPFSPRDAQRRTTRAPASASRASVPPHAIDSSSGWANTARMVRPEKSGNDALVDGEIFVYHPLDPEPFHRAFANAAPIERKRLRQILDHLTQVVEN